jgi:hypothetical protein
MHKHPKKCAKTAHFCTFVQVCVHFSLNFVNFVHANIRFKNNTYTFAADFEKKCLNYEKD